ncbi:hypothetical protein [Kitasatospora camelliae]|uniref:Uncharacterized protein n=1 Tax=Kitasatospora camelliae TaxID=3156397 RepID=A0AAU8JNZ9_9ACTN
MDDTPPALELARPVRGVEVLSRQTLGACAPTFGRVELDFEPLPPGGVPRVELACTAHPEPDPAYEAALARGVLRELSGRGTRDPEARRGVPVRALVLVRSLRWHWTDSCERVFDRLGALAVREALACGAEDRSPRLVVTRVRL